MKSPILQKLLEFRETRDWLKFHTPENIAKSIVLESAEILEIFQWKTDKSLSKAEKEHLKEEISDVYNWILLLCHDLDFDLESIALEKIMKNDQKYPVQKCKGIAKKYTQL